MWFVFLTHCNRNLEEVELKPEIDALTPSDTCFLLFGWLDTQEFDKLLAL